MKDNSLFSASFLRSVGVRHCVYFCGESDEFITDAELYRFFCGDEYAQKDYESFSAYRAACMTANNGTLELFDISENAVRRMSDALCLFDDSIFCDDYGELSIVLSYANDASGIAETLVEMANEAFSAEDYERSESAEKLANMVGMYAQALSAMDAEDEREED